MKPSDKITLSSKDIQDIILTSAQHKVSKLKFGDLEIEFGKPTEPQDLPLASDLSASTPDKAISEQQHEQQNEDALLRDELSHREQQVAMLIIEDPSKAEELLLEGEFEDDESDDEDIERDESE